METINSLCERDRDGNRNAMRSWRHARPPAPILLFGWMANSYEEYFLTVALKLQSNEIYGDKQLDGNDG